MATGVWTIVFVLAGLLLAFTTYAAVVGLLAVFTSARYLQCPRCHHHYLISAAEAPAHECPHGIEERMHQAAWSRLHHAGH
jgi:hypothetical protein